MKNIESILKSIGIEIPEDKKEAFDKSFNENYKTVSEVEKIQGKLTTAEEANTELQNKYNDDIKQRDTDLATLKSQLAESEGNADKLKEVTAELETLQTNYANAKTEYEKNLAKQQHDSLVREATNGLKFSSNSAKKAFLSDALAQNLVVKDGSLLGFNDFVEKYKETDADAFKVDAPAEPDPEPTPKPSFVSKSGNPKEPKEDDFEYPPIL